VVLVFSERQVDVLGAWEGEADCTVITRLSVLPKLRNRQQLTALIRSGDLEVQGDLQVVQNTVALCDLAEFDPLNCWRLIPAISLRKASVKSFAAALVFCCTALSASSAMSRKRSEEWRLAPGPLELAWFAKKPRLLNARWPHWKNGWKRWRANDARRITAPVFYHPHLFELRA
jgi:ubiquinone biosynthesis protein UbiJ